MLHRIQECFIFFKFTFTNRTHLLLLSFGIRSGLHQYLNDQLLNFPFDPLEDLLLHLMLLNGYGETVSNNDQSLVFLLVQPHFPYVLHDNRNHLSMINATGALLIFSCLQ